MNYPSIQPFYPETKMQPWGTETLIASTPTYTGKVLVYHAGKSGGFQYHVEKDETFYLHSGQALVTYVEKNTLVMRDMEPGDSFHIPAGAPHKFKAITECVVFEASTPHVNDRVNVGAELGMPDPDGTLPSTWHREHDGTHLRLEPQFPTIKPEMFYSKLPLSPEEVARLISQMPTASITLDLTTLRPGCEHEFRSTCIHCGGGPDA